MKESTASSRPYRMVARAKSTAATRERILDAAVDWFWDHPSTEVSLEDIAERADVSSRTVLRHFGTKQGLFEAAVQREGARIERQRDAAPSGDLPAAVEVLVDHYEEMGHRVLRLLAEERVTPGLREVADIGRASHRAWCERVFAASLSRLDGVDHERRLAQFVAVCDVYSWALLRRDAGLNRQQTEQALLELLQALAEVST